MCGTCDRTVNAKMETLLIKIENTTKVNVAFFYVLLTVHLNIFILVINQIDAQNFVLQ
jgi:hypothetical protein